ncbi:hypothetical protein TIFTF001_022301 [Ficus carica]|uniref:Reverse transcriptase domain-containing protein n=1 Tax=Ficus carica TaxID=3494 RepID=A0AA88AJP5_FICCA|nr:hypothetical protein TIFTF001_022301 [Ficus carica]
MTDSRRAEAPSGQRKSTGRFRQNTPLVATVEHVLNQVSGRGLLRNPSPLQTDRAQKNQNKYYNFHKDVGHDTKDCIQLCDQIELLVRDGHLREFVEKIITPAGAVNKTSLATHPNPGPSNRPNDSKPEHIAHTIFGGDATGATTSSWRNSTPITFTDDEADRLLHLHNDALIGEIRVADNVIRRVLIDNGSSADILFMDAFTRLRIEGAVLTPARTSPYRFTGECVRAVGTVSLPVTVGDDPKRVTRMVEFIIVDRPFVYNVILGRPTLNTLKAMVSTYHLAMKFPTPRGIEVFRGNQEGARKCYIEAVNKVCRKALELIILATIFKVDEVNTPDEEIKRPQAGHRPKSDLGQLQGKPKLTVGGVRAGPNLRLLRQTLHSIVFRTTKRGLLKQTLLSSGPRTTERGSQVGHRSELDLGQFQEKPKLTVGDVRAGPNWVRSQSQTPTKVRLENVATFDPKAPCWEELPEHQIHVVVGNPQTPSIERRVAGPQVMNRSYRHSPWNFGPIGRGRNFSGGNPPGSVVESASGMRATVTSPGWAILGRSSGWSDVNKE